MVLVSSIAIAIASRHWVLDNDNGLRRIGNTTDDNAVPFE
jgi:hypothetical protein